MKGKPAKIVVDKWQVAEEDVLHSRLILSFQKDTEKHWEKFLQFAANLEKVKKYVF